MSTLPKPSAFDWSRAWMQHRDCLPHLRQQNVLYFITFRLADSLPEARLQPLRAARDLWLAQNPPPHTAAQELEYRKIWSAPVERLLDAGHGACLLRQPECRSTIEATMRHDDGQLYGLGDFVIMPNHVHVLLHVPEARDLSSILQAWKSISARRINRILTHRGSLWQPEPFDHIVRDESHWQRFINYIRTNPSQLPSDAFTLGRGSLILEAHE
jgi:putative transposase